MPRHYELTIGFDDEYTRDEALMLFGELAYRFINRAVVTLRHEGDDDEPQLAEAESVTIPDQLETLYARCVELDEALRLIAEAQPTRENWNAVVCVREARDRAWSALSWLTHPKESDFVQVTDEQALANIAYGNDEHQTPQPFSVSDIPPDGPEFDAWVARYASPIVDDQGRPLPELDSKWLMRVEDERLECKVVTLNYETGEITVRFGQTHQATYTHDEFFSISELVEPEPDYVGKAITLDEMTEQPQLFEGEPAEDWRTYLDRMSGPEINAFAAKTALMTPCPYCDMPAGHACIKSSGGQAWTSHMARVNARLGQLKAAQR